MDILGDDLAALADEDGAPGGRAEALIAELQSFTDLAHSKGRRVAALQWLPHRKVRPAPRSWLARGSQSFNGQPRRGRWRAALRLPMRRVCKSVASGLKCAWMCITACRCA